MTQRFKSGKKKIIAENVTELDFRAYINVSYSVNSLIKRSISKNAYSVTRVKSFSYLRFPVTFIQSNSFLFFDSLFFLKLIFHNVSREIYKVRKIVVYG